MVVVVVVVQRAKKVLGVCLYRQSFIIMSRVSVGDLITFPAC